MLDLFKVCVAGPVKRFFKKLLGNNHVNNHVNNPRVINVDKNRAFPPAYKELQNENIISKKAKLRGFAIFAQTLR